jgi:LytS/YehU family sensor histidine kinase
MEVPEEVMPAGVPALLLQPLVENAIRHGTSPRTGRGRIEVRGARSGEQLTLEIRDSGRGFPPPAYYKEGLGLRNTRERLRQLYGTEQAFTLANDPAGGAVVTITLPFLPCGEVHTPLHLRLTPRAVPA